MPQDIMKYESKIWSTADLLRGVGFKESTFPEFMMPFFALMMVESRLIREADKAIYIRTWYFLPDKEILEALKGSSVLTVGEMDNFLENGGIINFLIRDRKVCFEVNTVAAKDARLKIRSKLLRLAKRVIGENGTGMKGTKTVR